MNGQESRAKQWEEEFGDHDCCPVCGTDCQMLFVEDVSVGLTSRVQTLESALLSIARVGETLLELHGPTIARLARSVLPANEQSEPVRKTEE